MKLQQLRYFVEVARELHFGRAAARLGVAQPPLSIQIKALETELETQLLHRENRWKISLTPAGELLLREGNEILRHLEKTVRNVRLAGSGKSGHLTIGVIASILQTKQFPEILDRMRHEHPGIILEIRESTSEDLTERILDGRIDIGFFRLPPEHMGNDELCIREFRRDRLLLAVPAGHKFAKRKSIRLAELADEWFIQIPEQTGRVYRNHIDSICRVYGKFNPNILQEGSGIVSILSLLSCGGGVALVPTGFREFLRKRIRYIPLKDNLPDLPVMLVRRDETPSPALRRFLSLTDTAPAVKRIADVTKRGAV